MSLPPTPPNVTQEKLQDRESITVATWNLMHSTIGRHTPRLIEAAAHLEDVDVLFMQEAATGDGYDTAGELAQLLGMSVVGRGTTLDFSGTHSQFPAGHRFGTAILTRLPSTGGGPVTFPQVPDSQYTFADLTTPSGRSLAAFSAHLAWGGASEATRLRQARDIDLHARALVTAALADGRPAPLILLGGDFNTSTGSDTVRYLTGLHSVEADSTFWVDAWEVAGTGDGHTSCAANPWSAETAQLVGITDPTLLPDRRLDYLMVHGWTYGRPGHPLHAALIGDRARTGDRVASDHYGIIATIADPLTR
jgi:endonuclease/exonuclease/phosphatase family metal-dependent hydrolase